MQAARSDRTWLIGGALVAAILLGVGWFFLISPQYQQTQTLQDQSAEADLRLAKLQRRLVDLRKQNGQLEQYRTQLGLDREALPTISGLSDFLRELQAAGITTSVTVNGLLVGAPLEVPGAASQIFALPMTLIVAGAPAALEQFLNQIQQLQPRAVLINSMNAVPDGQSGSFAGTVTLTLSLQVFVAPPAGAAPAAAPAATPAAATADPSSAKPN